MAIAEWLTGFLGLNLPSQFTLGSEKTDILSGDRLHTRSVIQDSVTWTAADTTLHVDVWTPDAPFPGGPMVVVRERHVRVAGSSGKVVETSTFNGRPLNAIVLFMEIRSPHAAGETDRGPRLPEVTAPVPPPPAPSNTMRFIGARLRLVATGITRPHFDALFSDFVEVDESAADSIWLKPPTP